MPAGIAAGSAFTGRLSCSTCVAAPSVHGRIWILFPGVGELRNVSARLPLDPTPGAAATEQRGNVSVDLKRLVLGAGPRLAWPKAASSCAICGRWARGRSSLAPINCVRRCGAAQWSGARETARSEARCGGRHRHAHAAQCLVQGYITSRSADAERLVRDITLGAAPDASGAALLRRNMLTSVLTHVDFPPGGGRGNTIRRAPARTQARAPGAHNASAAPHNAALQSESRKIAPSCELLLKSTTQRMPSGVTNVRSITAL
jgi:hypothetical protein